MLVVYTGTTRAITPAYLDSVKAVLNTTNSNKVKSTCLYTLSYEYGLIEPKKGIEYGKQLLTLAVKEGDLYSQLNAYNGQANAYETLGNFDSAAYFHGLSFEIAKKRKSSPDMALTLFNVALCLKQMGDYNSALQKYVMALKILENQKSYNVRAHFFLGEMYLLTGDIKNAEIQSRIGISKTGHSEAHYIRNFFCVNLARCYLAKGELDSALVILDTTLINAKANTDRTCVGICLNALGETYIAKKDYKKALSFFSEELALQEEIKNVNGIYLARLNMANTAAHIEPLTVSYVKGLLTTSEQELLTVRKNYDILINAYYKTAETYELINDMPKALRYYKLYYALKDSLLSKERFRQLSELQTQYETAKKESQIKVLKQAEVIRNLELNAKNETIRRRNMVIALGIALIVLIGILFYFFVQRKKLQNRLERERAIKATEENERLRIAKDIHDDLGSGLSKINFLSEMISRDKDLNAIPAEHAEAISETSKKLIVNMKDLIWALNPENTTLSGLVSRVREHSSDYLEDYPAELKLSFPDHIGSDPITKEAHRQILMTIKESLNNIVKHSKASAVEIETTISGTSLLFNIRDNGIGISERKSTGNGLGNMKARIESIGGIFMIESKANEGTLIALNISIENIRRH